MAGPCHIPVMLEEAMAGLQPCDGGVYVDGNLGGGGHSRAILERSAPTGRVVAFDLDAGALEAARRRLSMYGERILFCHANFAALPSVLDEHGIQSVDGILLDLGLSSTQLEESGRGFSFQRDEPLDMRMNMAQTVDARQLVNTLSQQELADLLYFFGEERQARRIAAFIVAERKKRPIVTTGQLVAIIERAVPRRYHPRTIHVATRSFQALRIAVNQELESLTSILSDGVERLAPAGRFCVISFHSLEDRLVKKAFRDDPRLRVVTRKPVVPSADECQRNARARSAKLRIAEREQGYGA